MWISLKLSKFILDLLEYKALFIWNLISFGSVMFVLPKPSTKVVVLDMVLTLAFINVNSMIYFSSRRIVCVVAQSARHTSSSFILRLNNTLILDITNIKKKTRHNVNNKRKSDVNMRHNTILFYI